MSQSSGLSNFKSICVIIVVIGCFAVLWPKIFYPMFMYGIQWNSRGSYLLGNNDHKDEYLLPPKVRDAMRSSPIIDTSKKSQKLPGRPQFYTSKRVVNTGSSQNSVWNLLIPLYALILVIVFLYALFKLSLKTDSNDAIRTRRPPPLHDPKECRECRYDQIRREYTNKRYDPFLSRSTYRTFDYYGRKNVRDVMHSLVDDVKKFREQLVKAEICQCKMAKYEEEFQQAKNILDQMVQETGNDQPQNSDKINVDHANNKETIVAGTKINDEVENQSNGVETMTPSPNICPEVLEMNDENKEILLVDKEASRNGQEHDHDSKPNEPLNREKDVPVVKKQKNYLHQKITSRIFADITNAKLHKKRSLPIDWKLIQRINHKFEKLMHAKEKSN